MMKDEERILNVERLVIVLLTVFLIASIISNLYFYSEAQKLSQWQEEEQGVIIHKMIQGGMGSAGIQISEGPRNERLCFLKGCEFNVTAGIGIWDPYTPAKNVSFLFSLYVRPLHGEYPSAPVSKENIVVQKHKDEMYVDSVATLNATAPTDDGIYIYQLTITCRPESPSAWDCVFEFPILIGASVPIELQDPLPF